MKQAILLLIIYASVLSLTSCGGSTSKSNKSATASSGSQLEAAAVEPMLDLNHYITDNQTAVAIYPDAIKVGVARAAVAAYNINAIPTTNYFIFSAPELTTYIDTVMTGPHKISALHFLLAFNNNATTLCVCAVNGTEGHTYEVENGHDTLVISSMTAYSVVPVPISKVAGSYSTTTLPPAIDTVSVDSALKMVQNYTPAAQPQVDRTALSFIVEYKGLEDYIKASPTIVYLEAYLANDFNRLTLVFVGLDAAGKPVYMSDGNNGLYVLEHCMPCPTCNVTRSGYGLE